MMSGSGRCVWSWFVTSVVRVSGNVCSQRGGNARPECVAVCIDM